MGWDVHYVDTHTARYRQGDRWIDIDLDWRDQAPSIGLDSVAKWAPPYDAEVILLEQRWSILHNLRDWFCANAYRGIYVPQHGTLRCTSQTTRQR